jgi:hypothetical protein
MTPSVDAGCTREPNGGRIGTSLEDLPVLRAGNRESRFFQELKP